MRYYQQQQPNPKHVLLVVAFIFVFGGCFLGYDYFSAQEVRAVDDPLTVDSSSTDQLSPLTPDQTAILSRIDSIKLDDTVLKDPAFQSLQDLSVQLGQEDAGKVNPFAPLPGQAQTKTTTKR